MVQIQENWANIRGRVRSVEAATDGASFKAIIEVMSSDDIPPFPNLMRRQEGAGLTLQIPANALKGRVLDSGMGIVARVRLARPGLAFVHPDGIVSIE